MQEQSVTTRNRHDNVAVAALLSGRSGGYDDGQLDIQAEALINSTMYTSYYISAAR